MSYFTITPTAVYPKKYTEGCEWTASIKCGTFTIIIAHLNKNIGRSALEKPTCLYYVPLLKSALQKAIRLQKTEDAVAIAYQLLRQDPTEFLRRLPIYMLEDTYLQCSALIRSIWLMCAVSKGWKLTDDDIRYLLGLVELLCKLDYHELLDMKNDCDTIDSRIMLLRGALTLIEQAVVCIWIRSEFGGMNGDICFLRNLADTWLNRDKEGLEIEEEAVVLWQKAFPSCENLYLFEGVDFHCYPNLYKEIKNIGWEGTITNEEFRRVMWYGQSCINTRDWLFEDSDTVRVKEEHDRLLLLYGPLIASMRPYLEAFSKKAWLAKLPEKSIDMYFNTKKT